ncbi:MAG TPA: acyltransferase [Acidisphaera sp.]|nr:acyltransferase [Acidisphaera sp.]
MKLWRLEAMRGVAAAWVLLAHAIDHLTNTDTLHFGNWRGLSIYGSIGVSFFFVLSGFVMIVSHPSGIGRTRDVGRFLWRPFCRIYPFFWLMLAYAAWLYGPGSWRDLVAWASLLPIRLDYLLIPAWTLQQEVCFYLLFAVCLLPRIGRWALASWVVAVILLNNPWPIGWPAGIWGVVTWRGLNAYTYLFFAGMLAGVVLPRIRAGRPAGVTLCLLGTAIVAGRLAFDDWGRVDGPTYAYVLYGVGFGCIILGLAALDRSVFALSVRARAVAKAAGVVSYPLYLSHWLTIETLASYLARSGAAARIGAFGCFVVLVAVSLFAAAMLAYGVDQPVQGLLRRLPRALARVRLSGVAQPDAASRVR